MVLEKVLSSFKKVRGGFGPEHSFPVSVPMWMMLWKTDEQKFIKLIDKAQLWHMSGIISVDIAM